MKKTVYLPVSIAALLLTGCSTELKIVLADVPLAVVNSFQAKYPAAQSVEWEAEKLEGHLVFEAEFRDGHRKTEAYFRADGTFVKAESSAIRIKSGR